MVKRPLRRPRVAAPECATFPLGPLPAGEELVEHYEALRDATREGSEGRREHPNLGTIMASPLERAKDRWETACLADTREPAALQAWYDRARREPCTWWLDHQLAARHAFHSCMSCGICVSQCPAARFHSDYSPRKVVDIALSRDEARLEALLSSEELWLCGQCGTCKARCPRGNSVMGLVSSLRQLAQLKGWHVRSSRGRQQYAARHLWGANFWNRGLSMHFRNVIPVTHADFGPRWADWFSVAEDQMKRVGADPDREGSFGGRYTNPAALAELRACVIEGGTIALWQAIETSGCADAENLEMALDDYLKKVASDG